jgi:putative FmdB family regulatory protein
MPLYEYECKKHGVFDEQRSMDESEASLACPACGAEARRILSPPRLRCMAKAESTARARNERSCHEPRVVSAEGGGREPHPPSSGRGSEAGGRPWMIGHS